MGRIKEIDMMKGFAVILVMMIHLWTNAANSFQIIPILGFSLAGFFLVSGYFLKCGSIIPLLKKRLPQLMLPFLNYYMGIVILCGGLLLLAGDFTLAELFRATISEIFGKEFLNIFIPGFYLKNALHRPLTVTWFFVQLCLATSIAIIILRLCEGKIKKLYLAICGFLSLSMLGYHFFGIMPLQIQMTCAEVAFMLLGYCAKETRVPQRLSEISTPRKIMLTAAGFALVYLLFLCNPGVSFMANGRIGNTLGAVDVPSATAQVLIGSCSLYLLCGFIAALSSSWPSHVLNYIGRNSLDYVMAHMPIAWLAQRFFDIPLALDYVKTPAYQGDASSYVFLGIIFLGNLLLCTLWIRVKNIFSR